MFIDRKSIKVIEMRIKPLDNSIKNRYDSIFKIATHSFTNALIQITELPDDEYEVVSCEIFAPGRNVKSMDILLKGKKGFVNIEFHKQPLSRAHLSRDFEYVIQYFFFYDEPIDQKIVVIDNDRKSIDRLQIMPDLEYKGKLFYVPNFDGKKVLNNIKNKIRNEETPTEDELYIFSILPLTNHGYADEEELMKELCSLTPELKISEKNREYISLCHMILVELFVEDDYLKEELVKVITMTSSYIEKRENELKHRIKVAEQEAKVSKEEAKVSKEEARASKEKAKVSEEKAKAASEEADFAKGLLKEIAEDDDVKLNDAMMKKILSVTGKM